MRLLQYDRSVFPPSPLQELKQGLYSKYAMFLKNSGGSSESYTYTLKSRQDVIDMATGSTYYFDANSGNDSTGDGSSGSPWQTLTKAKTCAAGSLLLFRNGSYGELDESGLSNRASWTVWMNDVGHSPEIKNIDFVNGGSINVRFAFYGFKFEPDDVSQTTDPQDPLSGSSGHDYYKAPHNIYATNKHYLEFYNCLIYGKTKHLSGEAFYLTDCDYVNIERCELYKNNRGITYTGCDHLTIAYNYIHNTDASFINNGNAGANPNTNVLIEGNHCHDMNWAYAEDWCNRYVNTTPHGSCVALGPTTGPYVVRNNIFHDGGPNTGIGFYTGSTYSNVTIENNLIYDIHSSFAMKVGDIGSDVVIRNNTVSARGKYTGADEPYKYYIPLNHYQPGYTGGLSLYNNIFIGGVTLEQGISNINEGNNIYWCCSPSGYFASYYTEGDLTNSKLKYGTDDNYFDTDIFTDNFDRSWYYWNVSTDIWYNYTLSSPGHQLIQNLTIKSGTEPINFGDSNNQPADSLGALDSNNKFIIPNGKLRSSTYHDAGCYQR